MHIWGLRQKVWGLVKSLRLRWKPAGSNKILEVSDEMVVGCPMKGGLRLYYNDDYFPRIEDIVYHGIKTKTNWSLS